MEPSTFQLYKISKKQNTIYLVLTIIMFVSGIVGVIMISFFDIELFYGKTALYTMFVFQGGLGIYIARNNFKAADYFVSWDDKEIRYNLPCNKELETIKIDDIKSIDKEPQDIQIKLKNNESKHFKFTYFYFPKWQNILDYFEYLKAQVDRKNILHI